MENFIFCAVSVFCFYRGDGLGGCGERHPETYWGPCETSKMWVFFVFLRFFVQQLTIFAKRHILDIWKGSEYVCGIF